jgi:hypothetical protein
VEACLAAFESRGCTFDDGHALVIPPCDALTPLVPVGGLCTGSASFALDECVGAAECEANPNGCGGKCVDHLAEGAACTITWSPPYCASGTTCFNGRCGKRSAGLNQPCGVGCAEELYCDSSGLCRPKRSSGPCVDANDCLLPSNCLGPPGATRCIRPGQPGETCNPAARECAIPGACSAAGVCSAARAAIGERCGLVNGQGGDYLNCVEGATCSDVSNVCVANDPNRCGICPILSLCDSSTMTCKPCPIN